MSDTTHDAKIARFISAAREQLENDTGYALITQGYSLLIDAFPVSGLIDLPVKPIQSITSITYYDASNAQQTLDASVYGLDQARRTVFRKHDQDWPDIAEQHNGIAVNFTAGFGVSSSNVPAICRQAILLQLTKWFVHRGDEGQVHGRDTYNEAYNSLVNRMLRTSYP